MMRCGFAAVLLAFSLSDGYSVHAGDCPIQPAYVDPAQSSWTAVGSGTSVVSQSGQFPGAVRAVIRCGEDAGGSPCGSQPGGNRYGQITLSPGIEYAITVRAELTTWDWWTGDDEQSDVFYMSVGPQAFTNIGSLGGVSCGQTQFSPTHLTGGQVWWWGDASIHCTTNCTAPDLAPCEIDRTTTTQYQATGTNDSILRVGLSTGTCTNSHGTYTVTIVPLRMDLVDPNHEGSTIMENGQILADPTLMAERITGENLLRVGVCADGVTQVLLRHEVQGPGLVTFQVEELNGAVSTVAHGGDLSNVGGDEHHTGIDVDAVQLADGRWMAVAVYRSPRDFVSTPADPALGCRSIRVRAIFEGGEIGTSTCTRLIRILRPPVVFIHGIWSDAETWDLPLIKPIGPAAPYTVVNLHNYWSTRASSFFQNRFQVGNAIENALERMRNPLTQNIATTQVSVVAHSMGGVLTRLFAAEYGGVEYFRNDNFNLGDIHKFIGLSVPHKGSPVATQLLRSGIHWDIVRLVLSISKRSTSEGAVADLRPNSEPIIWMNQRPVDFAAHDVVSVGGSTLALNTQLIGTVQPREERIVPRLTVDWLNIATDAFDGEPHDTLVGLGSQTGNSIYSTLHDYIDGENPAIHTTVTKEPWINDTLVTLLNTNVDDVTKFGDGYPTRQVVAVAPPDLPVGDLVEGLAILSPINGANFNSGSSIPVVLVPLNRFEPERTLLIGGSEDATILESGNFLATVEVPENYVGPITLFAASYDAEWNFARTEEVVVNIIAPANLTGLTVTPETVELARLNPTESLTVTGHYSDDIDREITLGAQGTIYVSSDPAVVTVSVDGVLTSVDFGSAEITVSNGGFSDTVDVEVVGLPCPTDINFDDNVDVTDLLEVITSWGPCVGCAADLDGSGVVDVTDMLAVITEWGPCPAPVQMRTFGGNNNGCLDAIKWGQYLDILTSGSVMEVECWNCWAYWHLCVCAAACDPLPPDCGCEDPFEN